MSAWKDWKTSLRDGKNPCYRCRKNGLDKAGDNYHHYGEGAGGYCHSCGFTQLSDDEKELRGINDTEDEDFEIVGREFNKEIFEGLKRATSVDGKGYRGLKKETTSYFGVMHEFNPETGKVVKQYYPCTKDAELSGLKIRVIPKQFDSYGETGKACDPFGWFRFKDNIQKTVVIAAGEVDALSIYQILKEYVDSKGQQDYGYYPVVSSTLGESNVSQLQDKYEWFDRFSKIIICYDNDDVGRSATEKLAKVLPRGKVYTMDLSLKDANCYIWDKDKEVKVSKEKEFVNLFFKARKILLTGVTGSSGLLEKMKEYVSIPRITLPKFLHKLEEKLRGGFPIGYIINLMAASGAGKSTYVDAMILHWVLNTPYKVGIVSLEASEGEYGVNIGSAFLECKINLGLTCEDRLASITNNEEALNGLFLDVEGNDRFYIVDPDVENMKQKIEYLVVALGCKIIVIDPIQDIFDALPEDQQASFMKWEKDLVKREQVTIINISHSRKSQGGQKAGSKGADLSEEDMMGHSSIYKSGGINIIISRNKEDEDEFEKNVSKLKVTKARGIGFTGYAGEYYYHNETHKIWDKDDWLERNVREF